MGEIWKPIPGYGLHYEASSLGRIRSKDRAVEKFSAVAGRVVTQHYKGKILKPCKTDKWGHLVVHLGVDGRRFNVHVARLVLLAFEGIPEEGQQARHLFGDPSDNRPASLAWGTQADNNADRHDHGRYAVGEEHPEAKLTETAVSEIRNSRQTGVEMALKFGVSTTQVSRIRRGQGWAHVA